LSEPNPTDHGTDSSSTHTARRGFLQGTPAAAGSGLLSTSLSALADQDTHRKRPNLVFFFGEGLRADALSIAGNPILKTPHQDRIGFEKASPYLKDAHVTSEVAILHSYPSR
jgi:hypothetical protein